MYVVSRKTDRGYPYLEFSDLKATKAHARKVAEKRLPYVHDTWLARTDEGRLNNLLIGFVAQDILEEVFRRAGLDFISYDATRIDEYKNDDPFDFLLLPPGMDDKKSLIQWLRQEIYPAVNSQGRIKSTTKGIFKERLEKINVRVADLKSSVDNHSHGIDSICHEQHHIAYAEQKNDAGFLGISGMEYLARRRQTFQQYIERKRNIKDVHFRVFFSSGSLETGFYVGFTFGRELVKKGTVSPFPGTPWVLYHKQTIADCHPPGTEKEVIFGR